MVFPDVLVTLGRRGPFVVLCPRQVHPFDEIANRNDLLGWDWAAVDGCHVPLSFSFDVGAWTFPACRNFAEQIGDSLTLDRPTNTSTFPVTNVPAVADPHDCAILLSVSNAHAFPFLLRSRAATASLAIRRRSAAENFSALAFPPLLACQISGKIVRARIKTVPFRPHYAKAIKRAVPRGGFRFLNVTPTAAYCALSVR